MRLLPESKIYTITLLSFLLMCGVALYYWQNLYLFYLIQTSFSSEQTSDLKPVLRQLDGGNPVKTTKLSPFFIRLETPWTLRDQREDNCSILYHFQEHKSIIVRDLRQEGKLTSWFLKGTSFQNEQTRQLLGKDTLKSDFKLMKLCLNINPDEATIFTPKEDLVKIISLYVFRGGFPADRPIYEFETRNGLKGFQFGKTSERLVVHVYLFDERAQLLDLSFVGTSQEEIDFILSSIQVI